MNSQLYNFYCHNGTDAAGRTFEDIMAFNDEQLESVHDYIQWVFPTMTPSNAQPQSPVLDEETIMILKQSLTFEKRFVAATEKMLKFWGISLTGDIPTDDMNKEGFKWLLRRDHNQLRIARLLESMRLLGFKHTSKDLFHKLVKFCGKTNNYQHGITAQNLAFWYQAASGNEIIP